MSDPFEAPYWNLLQVLAWVYVRDRSLVRDMADEPRDRGKIRVWERTAEGEKRVNARRPAPSLMELSVKGRLEDSPHYPTLKKGMEALSVELQNGSLTFLGRKDCRGELEAIPAEQWSDLSFYDDPPHVAPKHYFRPGAVRWHEVRGRREEVLAIWPDKLAEANEAGIIRAPAVSSKRVSSKALTAWYKERVKEQKIANARPGEREDFKAAKDKFDSRVTRDSIRELRHELAPDEWNVHKTGRKPKSSPK